MAGFKDGSRTDIAHRAERDSGPSVGVWLCWPCADDLIEKLFHLLKFCFLCVPEVGGANTD